MQISKNLNVDLFWQFLVPKLREKLMLQCAKNLMPSSAKIPRSLSTGALSYNCQDEYVHTKKWIISGGDPTKQKDAGPAPSSPRLPLVSFNHISREVRNIELTKQFYCDILGFSVIPRPPIDCAGYWLYGYGVSLHIIETRDKKERTAVFQMRIKHFSHALPRVDHIAFITHDLDGVQKILDEANVFYRKEHPVPEIRQIFLFDPDGNVIEVSNCAPEVGETTCRANDEQLFNEEERQSLFAQGHELPDFLCEPGCCHPDHEHLEECRHDVAFAESST